VRIIGLQLKHEKIDLYEAAAIENKQTINRGQKLGFNNAFQAVLL
jgi:hypothetical protein